MQSYGTAAPRIGSVAPGRGLIGKRMAPTVQKPQVKPVKKKGY